MDILAHICISVRFLEAEEKKEKQKKESYLSLFIYRKSPKRDLIAPSCLSLAPYRDFLFLAGRP
jgi:hypothetical protein